MAFDKSISLVIDGTNVVQLAATFTENESDPDEFRVKVVNPNTGDNEAEAVWRVRQLNEEFSLQITTQWVGAGICLAGCLAGIVSGPLVDCLKKAKTRNDVRACINQHGMWAVVGSISCIYGCLNL